MNELYKDPFNDWDYEEEEWVEEPEVVLPHRRRVARGFWEKNHAVFNTIIGMLFIITIIFSAMMSMLLVSAIGFCISGFFMNNGYFLSLRLPQFNMFRLFYGIMGISLALFSLIQLLT